MMQERHLVELDVRYYVRLYNICIYNYGLNKIIVYIGLYEPRVSFRDNTRTLFKQT
jgi:hypothetical protein